MDITEELDELLHRVRNELIPLENIAQQIKEKVMDRAKMFKEKLDDPGLGSSDEVTCRIGLVAVYMLAFNEAILNTGVSDSDAE